MPINPTVYNLTDLGKLQAVSNHVREQKNHVIEILLLRYKTISEIPLLVLMGECGNRGILAGEVLDELQEFFPVIPDANIIRDTDFQPTLITHG